MDDLKVYTLKDPQWDEIVRSFKDHDIYYISGYLKALETNSDGEPLLFFYDNGKTRGINVVLRRDIAHCDYFRGIIEEGKLFDFSTPYGYGGWIIEGEDKKELFDTYEEWCRENGIVCEFVRFHPLIENQRYSQDTYEVIPLGQVISMDLNDEETMLMNMSSRNRNKVRKAIKTGVTVNCCHTEKLNEFIEIYEETMRRDNAEAYYFFHRDYYDCLFRELKDHIMIFYAQLDGKILSSCIVFLENGRLSYHLAGSTKTSGNIYETNLLIYKTAEWGCQNGYRSFLLGGGVGSQEDYLYQFKRGFDDKHSYQFYIGKKTYQKDIYDDLVSKRTQIDRPGFFPAYRG
ncbi:MAG: peptidoglycan bridge formation glycyltransferase FemA/FemB family protein [Erysipelotrichaceae bacterium]|nr:peptidoglycan bridge formation glycyltransferase FemA/FemB family protein [Erysipelotrichaceae bacterium]